MNDLVTLLRASYAHMVNGSWRDSLGLPPSCSQGTQIGVQGTQIGVQGTQIGVQGTQIGVQGTQIGVHGIQIGVHGIQIGAHGTQVGAHICSPDSPGSLVGARGCRGATSSRYATFTPPTALEVLRVLSYTPLAGYTYPTTNCHTYQHQPQLYSSYSGAKAGLGVSNNYGMS